MELRHLRYFVAVAEECHFGRAAERLHMAQPPLSQQIKQLEDELGVQLLTRSTRRVELTPAGERYLERARSILAAIDAAGEEARLIRDGRMGRVAIGFTGSATYELLPRLSRTLRTELPELELDLRGELLTPSQVAGLVDGTLDVGFLRPPVQAPEVEVHPLRSEPLVAVLPESHALAAGKDVVLADLAEEPFITYPARHRSVVHDAVLDACQAAGLHATRHGGGRDLDPRLLRRGRTRCRPRAGVGAAPADHRSGLPPARRHRRRQSSSLSPRGGAKRLPRCARCWLWSAS